MAHRGNSLTANAEGRTTLILLLIVGGYFAYKFQQAGTATPAPALAGAASTPTQTVLSSLGGGGDYTGDQSTWGGGL